MGISVICTGTELLRGSTVNTTLAALGAELTSRGVRLDAAYTIGDRAEDLYGALAAGLRHSDILVLIGGLGPTADDLTLEATAKFFGVALHTDPELVRKVDEFWARLHQGHCPKNQYKQAWLPENGRAIPNPSGSASGIEFAARYDHRERHIFLMPGPPSEFIPMARNFVAPRLDELAGKDRETVRGFLAAGVGESFASRLAEKALGGATPDLKPEHFYAPWKGFPHEEDFKEFSEKKDIVLL